MMAREILHRRAAEAISHVHPGVNFIKDVIMQDDGNGPFIAHWGLPGNEPSAQQILAILDVIDNAPPPPPKTKRERLIELLATHNLTIDDLKAELGRQ